MAGTENKETVVASQPTVDVKKLNIFQKLSAISLEIERVNKNLRVNMGSGSYKAVGEADVLEAVKPTEAKYGIYSYPLNRKIIESGFLETMDSKGNVKKQFYERIEITYRFVNTDNPSEVVDMISYGDGIDSGDKSVGKGMTYGDKYALLKAYKIVTGDDPDQNASDTLKGQTTATATRTNNVQKSTASNQPYSGTKKVLSQSTIDECKELGISLEKIASMKSVNCKVEELNDEIVLPILVRCRKKLAEDKAKAEADATKVNDSIVLPDDTK